MCNVYLSLMLYLWINSYTYITKTLHKPGSRCEGKKS